MHTIDQYLDAAINRHRFTSDRDLGRYLGLSSATINQYRTKRSWPSPATMTRIADLAGENIDIALIELNIWKEQDETARAVYSRILNKLSGIAATVMLSAFIFPSVAKASPILGDLSHILYIMELNGYCFSAV